MLSFLKEIVYLEFGVKVTKYQIDSINLIGHLNFDAFHDGNRFQVTISKAQRLNRTKTKSAGADATKQDIRTDFKRKERTGKHEKQRKQMAAIIIKERAASLEGSLGKKKILLPQKYKS